VTRERADALGGSVRFEEDRSWENQARCPGFQLVMLDKLAGPQETLVRCIDPHPHQVILRVVAGPYGEERHEERRYPWVENLATEAQARERAQRRDAWRLRKTAETRASVEAARRAGLHRITPADGLDAVMNAPAVMGAFQCAVPDLDDGGYMGDETLTPPEPET